MRRIVKCVGPWVLLLTALSSRAGAAPITVSADATVAGGLFADSRLGASSTLGGLLSGSDGSGLVGPYRFYLMFALPVFSPNALITSATLSGLYNEDWDTFDDRTHSLYQAPSTWTESTITWNNQPGSTGAALGTFNAAQAVPGTFQSWNVTSAVNAAYLQQMALFSLLFRANDEAPGALPILNNNLEYFASREFQQGTRAFTLDVQLATVPEPTSLLLLATGLAAVASRRRTVRRRS